jgi:hypothetical protein
VTPADVLPALLHVLARARSWWHRNCTAAGRRATARRLRERELRAAGVSRKVAALAASRMVADTKPGRRSGSGGSE